MRYLIALLIALLPAADRALAVEARPALWKVSDADTTIWLFGTIHMLAPGIDWFRGPVADAFAGADELVVETSIPEPAIAQAIVGRLALDRNGPPIAARLPPTLNKRLVARMKDYGIPEGLYGQADPWYAAVLLETAAYRKLGLVNDDGAEAALIAAARRRAIPIVPLERFEDQIGLFDQLPLPVQVALLEDTLTDIVDSDIHVRALVDAWMAGDTTRLAHAVNEDMDAHPELRAVLLDRRNDHFAAWIARRMDQPGTVFLAVGAGHLGGDHNVRALLAERGFTIARVQ